MKPLAQSTMLPLRVFPYATLSEQTPTTLYLKLNQCLDRANKGETMGSVNSLDRAYCATVTRHTAQHRFAYGDHHSILANALHYISMWR
jgi:hypothetical protein